MKQIKNTLIIAIIIIVSCNSFLAHAQSWSLTGNSGTANGNFLGTTDNKKLNIRTNNQNRMTITSAGKIGIGTTTPSSELHLVGTMQIDRSSIGGATTPAMILNGIANNIVTVLQVDGIQKSSYGYDVSTNDFVIATDDVGLRPDFIINRTNGFVGLNTKTPSEQLHVAGKVRIDRASTDPYFLQLNTTNLGNALIQFTEGGIQTADMGFDHSTFTLRFCATSTGTRPDLTILSSNGNVGLGTSNPAARLHVDETSFISSISGTGAVQIGETSASNLIMDNNEMQARFNGAGASLYLNYWSGNVNIAAGGGKVGIGKTSTPDITGLQVWHGTSSGSTYGLRIQNLGANNNNWTLYTQNGSGVLNIYANGIVKGEFDDVSGTYTALSDQRFKKDIQKIDNVLPGVMKLDVKTYHFLENQTGDKKYIGMLAQDVEKVFPEVVYHNTGDDGADFYTMDYSSFGVIAIKAIQELNTVVAEKDAKISDLQKQIDEIKAGLQACGITCMNETGKASSTNSTGSILGQNIPNPANQTTTIQFSVPATASDAQLIITDINGQTVQQFNHLTVGQSQVEVSTHSLAAGTYQYSLYVDGRKVDTKQMIISK